VFNGIVFKDRERKKKENVKARITPTLGYSLEKPSDAFKREEPISSPMIARSR